MLLLIFLCTACRSNREYSSRRAAVFTSPTPASFPWPPSMLGASIGRHSSSVLMAWKASDKRTAIWCWSEVELSLQEALTCNRRRQTNKTQSPSDPFTTPGYLKDHGIYDNINVSPELLRLSKVTGFFFRIIHQNLKSSKELLCVFRVPQNHLDLDSLAPSRFFQVVFDPTLWFPLVSSD